MPANNFKLFDENKQNMLNDQEYQASQQRLSGVQAGIASSMLNNKFAYQMSLVAYAITQMMNANGYDATDALAVSAFVGNLSDSVLQKVIDKATTAEAQAGTNTLKWMTPALVKSFFDYRLATQAEAQAGTNNAKWMSPARVKAFYSYMAATESMAAAGTDTTHWMSPKATKAVIDKSIRIGDIKATVRTDLGNNWLLCNGEVISATDYPELTALLQQNGILEKWTSYSPHAGSDEQKYVYFFTKYVNGYWIIGAKRLNIPYILYTNDLNGTWAAVAIGEEHLSPSDIEYANGYWVVVCNYSYSSPQQAKVCVSSNLSSGWQTIGSLGLSRATCIKYLNNQWVVAGSVLLSVFNPAIAVATNPTSKWTYIRVATDVFGDICDVIYANGTFMFAGAFGARFGIYVSSNITGPFTRHQIDTSTDISNVSLVYRNGLIVAAITSNSAAKIMSATDISGAWTSISVASLAGSGFYQNSIENRPKLVYGNGVYVLAGCNNSSIPVVLAGESPTGTWGAKRLKESNEYFGGLAYYNGTYLFALYSGESAFLNSAYMLPTISADGSYVYIKAKEA